MECRITTIIFTLNEETNLPHCLSSLAWCNDIIVVDSGSSDHTLDLARGAGARVYVNPFQGFGTQRNWALESTSPRYTWVLILDADERVPDALAREMCEFVADSPDYAAARVRRRFYMWGKWLKFSSLYPTWVVRLVHRGRVRYINRGHAETQQTDGKIYALKNDLIDENHKGDDYWYERQKKYALADARYEIEQEASPIKLGELLSEDPLVRNAALKRLSWKLPFRQFAYFLYGYLLRQGFRDGEPGYRFCKMRAWYQGLVVTYKRQLRRGLRY